MQIPMRQVESTNVSEIGYDPLTQTLAVKFKVGTLYHYSGVSPDVYENFVKAASPGKFLRAHLIGKFDYKKVDPDARDEG